MVPATESMNIYDYTLLPPPRGILFDIWGTTEFIHKVTGNDKDVWKTWRISWTLGEIASYILEM